ncbi:hypothetical protein H310_12055 [Aphanomyces invadans]|uniref:Myb-like domain-containing protein n=1 Tax=Aphanomyces invadans TaxID=157072 RepID=A0A024TJ48_9STRA|nr:hypothetical protein H310_12055 [Aphanomyces invadans]ETV93999.1 hypothetical protein H310_12055 [Aphanomyces invadans]|eukprot:XP_008877202.1 hypothetical protein H310_12055 [Aphanomyces invadans]
MAAAVKGAKFGTSWSAKEDKKLRKAVLEQGKGHKANWKLVAAHVPGRTPGACQGRWNTVLDPSVDRSPWTPELDAQLLQLYKDPVYNSWSKRAAKLAEGKVGPNGEVMRRSGADTCDRYFKITKAKKGDKVTSDAEVKWTDETEDILETPPTIGLPVTPAVVTTRNQRNRIRRNERRKQFVAAKANAAESTSNADDEESAPPAKGGKKPAKKPTTGKRKAPVAAKRASSTPFKKQRQ